MKKNILCRWKEPKDTVKYIIRQLPLKKRIMNFVLGFVLFTLIGTGLLYFRQSTSGQVFSPLSDILLITGGISLILNLSVVFFPTRKSIEFAGQWIKLFDGRRNKKIAWSCIQSYKKIAYYDDEFTYKLLFIFYTEKEKEELFFLYISPDVTDEMIAAIFKEKGILPQKPGAEENS